MKGRLCILDNGLLSLAVCPWTDYFYEPQLSSIKCFAESRWENFVSGRGKIPVGGERWEGRLEPGFEGT